MYLSLILFLIGILGFVLNRKNIILMLISIEIMLLAITFLILVGSLGFDDIVGQTYSIYIIAIAGAESAIGLGILVAFYRLRGTIGIEFGSGASDSESHTPYFVPSRKKDVKIRGTRNYSTSRFTGSLNPLFVTGLLDAEGSFVVTI